MLTKSVTASVLFAVALATLAGCATPTSDSDVPTTVSQESAAVTEAAPKLDVAKKIRAHVTAKVDRVLLSPIGEPDGLLLDDGSVVRLPPRALKADALKRGDAVDVEGSAHGPAASKVLFGAIVKKGDLVVADATTMRGHHHGPPPGIDGPPPGDAPPPDFAPGARPHGDGPRHHGMRPGMGHDVKAMSDVSTSGAVVAVLQGHEGRVDAVVLDDGSTGRLSPHAAALDVKVGDRVTLTGHGTKTASGTGMMIESITLPSGETKQLDKAPPRPEKIEKHAKIQRVIVNPMGHADRLVLADGTQVRIRPDGATAGLTVGQEIQIEGHGAGSWMMAEQIKSVGGASLYADPKGPPTPMGARPALTDIDVAATITTVLRDPRGEIETLLLSDGSTVMVRGRLATQAAAGLVEGAKIQVRGKGGRYASGVSLFATSVTVASGETYSQPDRPVRAARAL